MQTRIVGGVVNGAHPAQPPALVLPYLNGAYVSRDQTPKELDMEPGEENLVEIV